ncbi:MAG TPA: hypothetical protein VN442_06660 [Bryobacteraceae bacterium]|nr:hypothetical protein [Bryobacteraceae bacterium]
MDIKNVIRELHEELARIDETIQTLEMLRTGSPRRGRPPNWLTLVDGATRTPAKKLKRKPAGRAAD